MKKGIRGQVSQKEDEQKRILSAHISVTGYVLMILSKNVADPLLPPRTVALSILSPLHSAKAEEECKSLTL